MRVLQVFGTAIVDQVVLSGANFVIGILLIRNAPDADYGLFVLVQSTVLLLITAQSAWLTSPLAILAPKRAAAVRHEMVGAVGAAQRRFLGRAAIAAFCIPAIGYVAKIWSAPNALIIAAGVLVAWTTLRREYLRRVLLIYSRTNSLLVADAIYGVIVVGGTAIAALTLRHAVIWAIATMAVAAWIGEQVARGAMEPQQHWPAGSAAHFLREMYRLGVWAAVGALSYWLFGQSYNYILATRLDLKAVAEVNASRLLIMPAIVFTIGLDSLLVPKSAGWLTSVGVRSLLIRLGAIFGGIAVIELVYFALVWTFRDWLTLDFLHKVIRDRDRLLALWAGIALIGLLRTVVQSALVAMEPLKAMAGITAAGAVTALALMWVGVNWWGPAGVLIGQIVGDTIVIIGFAVLLRHASRQKA
jgi:O-antigen/teichoic acid export membrane protein